MGASTEMKVGRPAALRPLEKWGHPRKKGTEASWHKVALLYSQIEGKCTQTRAPALPLPWHPDYKCRERGSPSRLNETWARNRLRQAAGDVRSEPPLLFQLTPVLPPPSPLSSALLPLALPLPLSFLPLDSVSRSHSAQQRALAWAFFMTCLHNLAAKALAELALVWLCCDPPRGPCRPLPVWPRLWPPDWRPEATWTQLSWAPKVHTEKLGSLALSNQPDDPLQSEPHYCKTLL